MIDDLLGAVGGLPATNGRGKVYLADKIFETLVVRATPPNPKIDGIIWRAILDRVWAWEDLHEEVHKGTAYYFMAESFLACGDVPSAYICFFNAIEDDKLNLPLIPKNYKDAPAYLTTSLSCNPNNALFSSVVMPLRSLMQGFIDGYNLRMAKSIRLLTLDSKFLQNDDVEEVKRFFVATFHEISHLSPINATRMINNDYSRLKVIDTLFNLGLIIDQLLERRFLATATGRKVMGKAVYQLALNQGWTSAAASADPSAFVRQVSPDLTDNPDVVVPPLLDGTASFNGSTISPMMRSILLAYHLRNFAGHHVEGQDILIRRYSEVLDSIMDAFFFSIELL